MTLSTITTGTTTYDHDGTAELFFVKMLQLEIVTNWALAPPADSIDILDDIGTKYGAISEDIFSELCDENSFQTFFPFVK